VLRNNGWGRSASGAAGLKKQRKTSLRKGNAAGEETRKVHRTAGQWEGRGSRYEGRVKNHDQTEDGALGNYKEVRKKFLPAHRENRVVTTSGKSKSRSRGTIRVGRNLRESAEDGGGPPIIPPESSHAEGKKPSQEQGLRILRDLKGK